MRRFRHMSYANVMSTIAVVAVLTTGTAWAAATIGSSDIKNNAVMTRHIKNNAVTSPKLASRTVRGGDVALNTIGASNLTAAARRELQTGGSIGNTIRATLDSPWQGQLVDTTPLRAGVACFGGYTEQPANASSFALNVGSEGRKSAWMVVQYSLDGGATKIVRTTVGAPDYFATVDLPAGTGGGTILLGVGDDLTHQSVFSYQTNDGANTCNAEWTVTKVTPFVSAAGG